MKVPLENLASAHAKTMSSYVLDPLADIVSARISPSCRHCLRAC